MKLKKKIAMPTWMLLVLVIGYGCALGSALLPFRPIRWHDFASLLPVAVFLVYALLIMLRGVVGWLGDTLERRRTRKTQPPPSRAAPYARTADGFPVFGSGDASRHRGSP
jgi:hypothetical protein